jgi:hypothetical protein
LQYACSAQQVPLRFCTFDELVLRGVARNPNQSF